MILIFVCCVCCMAARIFATGCRAAVNRWWWVPGFAARPESRRPQLVPVSLAQLLLVGSGVSVLLGASVLASAIAARWPYRYSAPRVAASAGDDRLLGSAVILLGSSP